MGSGRSRTKGPITRVNYLFHTLQEPAAMYGNQQMYGGYQQQQQPSFGYGIQNYQQCYGCR